MDFQNVATLLQKELRDSLRNRWFVLYTVAFTVLALGLSFLALSGAGIVGFAGFGRTAASLINLVLLIVPLMALTVGAQSLAAESERGTLSYLLAQPVTRLEVFVGKYLGLALAILAALTLGFGISGLVMVANGMAYAESYLVLVGLAFLLALTMLSVGFVISAFAHKAGIAIGISLFLWLTFVFLGDLGMMGTAVSMRLKIADLFLLASANPLQVFKMASILSINATLDVLGPAGLYALQTYGDSLLWVFLAVLLVWVLVPLLVAYGRFRQRGDF
ncbi:MAG: ABC transporter permease [Anaerolineae bacterium]|jgi:Cu-processing system permease protein|uniref:ABC transporter permease n=1 Tax=Candidatus Amarolinea dominans TaxID=3140696 RepID=UPI001D42DA10|nr:ABC transporter permease [Anaerolineae bacterium]MBK7199095.1 ABC transporter permease [Anaerolineae bacterium]MBK9095839.1 ABC transporter permease [Anaerolineae bacterium]MBK9230044.1 ABC transporter permease [Anaerolineae bacterium]